RHGAGAVEGARTVRRRPAGNLTLVAALREVASQVGAAPARAAPACCCATDESVISTGATKPTTYVEENAAAADIALTPEQAAAAAEAVRARPVARARYATAACRFF